MKTLLAPLDARPGYNDLFQKIRDRDAGLYRRVTECVAGALVGQIRYVIGKVQGHVDAVTFEVTPPDGMRGRGLPLLEAVQAAARRDPELQRSPLGRAARIRFSQSEPAPEPEPEPERPPEPAAPPVVAAPVDTRTFDLRTQLDAIAWWASIKHQLAQHPELKEPVIAVPVPRGVDADALLECIAREAAADPALGFKKVTLHTSPAVAEAPALRG